ncbi:DNA repair protein complementing XP-C cells isoform X1 [Parasteatoda tepidariorum]|uniref:DNA repair protein complementing XP-C cells isoform X1 n=1 Tax=Parasteatoda tepidariorum TaxID=114398 RepID=UPI001C72398D|nr:DNA repair protein complementing XP-C cells [Parasteatoda tepidariorum]
MSRRKQKLDHATVVENNNDVVERTPLRRSKRKLVNKENMNQNLNADTAIEEDTTKVDKTLLENSSSNSVIKKRKDQKLKVNETVSMSEHDIMIKTPRVLIKKLKIDGQVFSPELNKENMNQNLDADTDLAEDTTKVDETLLENSNSNSVIKKREDQMLKVNNGTISMSEQDIMIKTPRVLIKKLKIDSEVFSPKLKRISVDSGISSDLSLQDVSVSSTMLRMSTETELMSSKNSFNISSIIDYNNIDVQGKSSEKPKRQRNTKRKVDDLVNTSISLAENEKHMSKKKLTSANISTDFQKEKDSKILLDQTKKELVLEDDSEDEVISLRRSRRLKSVNEKSKNQTSTVYQTSPTFKEDHLIKKLKKDDETFSSEFSQSVADISLDLNLKVGSSLSTISNNIKETEYISSEKSSKMASTIDSNSPQVKKSLEKLKPLKNGEIKIDYLVDTCISSDKNEELASKCKLATKNISIEFQNEKELDTLLDSSKDKLFLGSNKDVAIVEGSIANSSSTGEKTIMQVLVQQEFNAETECKISSLSQTKTESSNNDSNSESDWEEVGERSELSLEDYNPAIPKDGVEITIDCPDLKSLRKQKKREYEMDQIRLCINRMRREEQLNIHKTHLLCLLAHGLFVNDILNSLYLKAFALSYLPPDLLAVTAGRKIDKANSGVIRNIVTWFCESFSFENKELPFIDFQKNIFSYFQEQKSLSPSEYNLMFVVFAQTLGFKTRFCVSFNPVSYKAKNLLKKSRSKIKNSLYEHNLKVENNLKTEKPILTEQESSKEKSVLAANNKKTKLDITLKKKKPRPQRSKSKSYKMSSDEDESEVIKLQPQRSKSKSCKMSGDEDESEVVKLRPQRSKSKSYKMSSDEYKMSSDEYKMSSDEDQYEEWKLQPQQFKKKSYKISSDEEDDFVEKRSSQRNNKKKDRFKKLSEKPLNRKILSSNSEPNFKKNCNFEKDKIICWCEVFSKRDKRWISVECTNQIIDEPYDIEKLLPQPVTYIVAYDNDCYIKDVTKRYCSEYMTSALKLRPDSEWWEETIEYFSPPNSKLNKEEEKKLDEMLINKPLPNTFKEYKNHPLYALKRHLLKFEAIYPPDAAPVGFIRNEPVYARDNVCILRSHEKWKEEGRTVCIGEEPYKLVKARPKWDHVNKKIITDLPLLEVFGYWQTKLYEPPVAEGGKVPRNKYGNVELFKPWMLPRGTVHLKNPGLSRIARKLGIDCSPAFFGFENMCAIYDGYVVCEEFKDTLLTAWEEEQVNAKERKEEKRYKRIYGNWKKLIKGLLIKERIKLKYGMK